MASIISVLVATYFLLGLQLDPEEAVRSSETSVNFYQTTRRRIPEDGTLHIESTKSSYLTQWRIVTT
jgi:predicted membrane-bound spermidine synthase